MLSVGVTLRGVTDWYGDPAGSSRRDRDPAAAWFQDTAQRSEAAWPGRPLDAPPVGRPGYPAAQTGYHDRPDLPRRDGGAFPSDDDRPRIAGHDDRPPYQPHDWAGPRAAPLRPPGQYDRPAHRAQRRTPTPAADPRRTAPPPTVSPAPSPVEPAVAAGRNALIATAGSYGAALVAFAVAAIAVAGSGAPGTARGSIVGRLVWFAIAVLVSLALGTPLRRFAVGWRPVTIGVVAAILGGGLVTAVASAVGGGH